MPRTARTQLSNEPSGASSSYRFASPFFNPGTTSISAVVFNLRHPGQCEDQESGLSEKGFRVYDKRTGRYTQTDPAGLNGGWNPFDLSLIHI